MIIPKLTTLDISAIAKQLCFCIILLPTISMARITLDCHQFEQDAEYSLIKRWSKTNQIKIDNVEPNSEYILVVNSAFQIGASIKSLQNMEIIQSGGYVVLKTHEIPTNNNISTIPGITVNVKSKSTRKMDSIKLLTVYLAKISSLDSGTMAKNILKEFFNG